MFRYFGGMLLAGDLLCIPHDPYMSHVTLGYLNLKDKTLARQPALRRLHTFRRTLFCTVGETVKGRLWDLCLYAPLRVPDVATVAGVVARGRWQSAAPDYTIREGWLAPPRSNWSSAVNV